MGSSQSVHYPEDFSHYTTTVHKPLTMPQHRHRSNQPTSLQYGGPLQPSYNSYSPSDVKKDLSKQPGIMDQIFTYSGQSDDRLNDGTVDKYGLRNANLDKTVSQDTTNRPTLLVKVNAKKTMAEISIPGMRAIFGHKAHLIRKIVWALILLVCTGIAGIQVNDRIRYYLSIPIAVNVRVSRNESLRFPVLTLCNKNTYNETAMEILREEKARNLFTEQNITVSDREKDQWDVPDLIGVRGMNALELWEFLAHSMEGMTVECFFGRNNTCNQRGRWERIHTYMGTCYSYVPSQTHVSLTGMFNNLYLKLNETQTKLYANDDGWKMLLHDSRDSPIIDVRTHGSTLYREWGKDVRVYIREFRTLSTPKRPCKNDPDYSYSKCIAQCFIEAVNNYTACSLPFMGYNRNSFPKGICNNSQSYKEASVTVENLLFYGLWSSNNCTCMRPCQQDIYVPYVETTRLDSKIGKLRVFYQDLTFDDIEEEIGYGAIPLLCDIGGSLGLLLGASVLTFFEIIEAMCAAVLHFFTRVITRCAK